MKPIETEIIYQGRTLKQLKREGMVAIYDQGLYSYEVIVIRIKKDGETFGKFYPEHEIYPSSEQWGIYGWTYRPDEREKAEKKFASLLPRYGRNVLHTPDIDDLGSSEYQGSGE
jgi:hypothetical protein